MARVLCGAVALASSLLGSGALAADPAIARTRTFSIPAESYSDALIDFAVQADVTLGGARACPGRSPGLRGRYTVEDGLKKLLAGAPCHFQMVDLRTVRILPGAAPTPPPPRPVAPRPAPPTEPDVMAAPVAEVVVTATKQRSSISRLPAAVSALSGDQLKLTGANDASDAVDQIAGVTITNLGPGRDKILLRGLSDGAFTGRTQSTVGTYLDDMPLNYNAPDPDLRLADVERIEVVRGPQGALYGGGSLSGVYRIVTHKPELDALSGQILGGAGWTESGSPSHEFEGVLNLPLVTDRMGLRIVGYQELQGGYLDDTNLRLSNVDRTTREGGRVLMLARLNDSWTLMVGGAFQHLASADTQYVTMPVASRRRANRVREEHENNFGQGSVTLTGEGSWGRFESSTAFLHHAFSSVYDASAALSIYGASDLDLGVYDEAASTDILVEDAVWTSPTNRRMRWLVGVYGSATSEVSPSDLRGLGSASTPPRLLYQEDRTDRLKEGAVYGELSYDLGAGWTLSAGARAFRTELRSRSDVTAPPPGVSRTLEGSKTFSGISPKLTLQHDLPGGGIAYALVSEGYRAGGFNSGGLAPPSPSRRQFSPDRLTNYELGAKLKLFDNRLDLRLAAFYDRWDDIQTDQYLNSGISFTANVGNGRNIGLESEATWRVTPNLLVQANALFDAPELTRPGPTLAAKPGAALPGVPDASFGTLALYQRPLRGELKLLLGAEMGYVGRSRLTFDPALSQPMGGYVTAKLSAQLVTPKWRLAAYVTNPANTAGDTFAYGNPFSFGQVRQVTPQRPRGLTLLLTRAF